LSYTLEVEAEPGGVRVTINLDKPLPQNLPAGRASTWSSCPRSTWARLTWWTEASRYLPRTPNDPMVKVLHLADEPKKAYYLEDWDKPRIH